MVSTIPNLTLDTSCVISLLHLPNDFTLSGDINALEKIQSAHTDGKIRVWISKKSMNESLMNLKNSESDYKRNRKWLDTLNLLDDFDKTSSVLVLDISRLDFDAVLASDEQADEYVHIKQIIKGKKTKLNMGDVYDITILYEHYLQHNDLFVTGDIKIFRPTIKAQLFKEYGIRVVSPNVALSILKAEYRLTFD